MPVQAQALALLHAGQAGAARTLLQSQPGEDAQHAFLLGACAHAMGDIPAALTAFTTALRRDPAHAPAACALGSLYAGLGRRHEAEALFRQTLSRIQDEQLWFNLAVVLEDEERLTDALQEYGALLRYAPDHYAARHNRAGLLARQMRLAEAAADYRELIQRHPAQMLPWQNLADIEIGQGHYEHALQGLAEVSRREPHNAKACMSQAIALAASGNFMESRERFARLQQLDAGLWQDALDRTNNRFGHATEPEPRLIFLVHQQEHLNACDWSRWPLQQQVFRDFIAAPDQGELISLVFRSQSCAVSAREQKQLAMAAASQIPSAPCGHPPTATPVRLRIGYCAASFGHHVMGLLLQDFFAAHDPAATEIFILALSPFDDSAAARTIRATPGLHWIDLSALDDVAAAAQIRSLQLDIAVDLSGYNDNPRPAVLAQRPAPVQVSWLCATYTSGAPWLDYYLGDARARPEDGWCSEAEVLLPDCYFLLSHDAAPPVAPPRAQLGLPENRFVFACLNAVYKIDPDTFGEWMQILQQAPDSVLWLVGDSSAAVLNLKREAEWRGIDPRRLLFAPRTDPAAHRARLGAADLFLDTRHYNGHTTVAEALWSGLPVLTCPGVTFSSRVAGSLLHSCGLPELVTTSREDYQTLALALYHDRPRLTALRARLQQTRLTAAPFDLARQARHIEKAFRHMRERFAQGLPPQPFNVADLPD